jgi:putative tryptophan/tyrosine transport system substrate-binding protein
MNGSKQPGMAIQNVIVLMVALTLASVHLAEAQQAKQVPVVGVLSSGSPPPNAPLVEAFRQGLHDFAYVEGTNILLEYRYAEGKLDRIPGLVAELIQ